MNNVSLLGRLTKDPELRYTQGGKASCRFTLAVDRGLSREKRQELEANNQPTADFIFVTAWGKTAELVANYLSKGRQVAIEGSIRTGSYENQEGQRVYTTEVWANRVHFISDGSGNRGGGSQYDQSRPGAFQANQNKLVQVKTMTPVVFTPSIMMTFHFKRRGERAKKISFS